MRPTLSLCVLLLAVTASVASAGPGLNLRWDTCFGDGGVVNRTFACNTNTGTNSMRASFVLASDLLHVSGVEAVVSLVTPPPVLPEWWEFKNLGSCRINSLSIAAYGGANCFDWALGKASMNIASYQPHVFEPNQARIAILNAVVLDDIRDLSAGVEYTAFELRVSNAGTVGTTCTGCQLGASLAFSSLRVSTVDLTSVFLTGPTNLTDSHRILWQDASTPTGRTTWSSVKALYR